MKMEMKMKCINYINKNFVNNNDNIYFFIFKIIKRFYNFKLLLYIINI